MSPADTAGGTAGGSAGGAMEGATGANGPVVSVLVDAGVCGHKASITAGKTDGYNVRLALESDCPHVQKIATEPLEVDALKQIGLRGGLPPLLEAAYSSCAHAACPVPSALIKAVEAAAGLALPGDVSMRISKEQPGTGGKDG